MARCRTGTAAVAFFFVYGDDSPDHIFSFPQFGLSLAFLPLL
jgi:hypothetical protein